MSSSWDKTYLNFKNLHTQVDMYSLVGTYTHLLLLNHPAHLHPQVNSGSSAHTCFLTPSCYPYWRFSNFTVGLPSLLLTQNKHGPQFQTNVPQRGFLEASLEKCMNSSWLPGAREDMRMRAFPIKSSYWLELLQYLEGLRDDTRSHLVLHSYSLSGHWSRKKDQQGATEAMRQRNGGWFGTFHLGLWKPKRTACLPWMVFCRRLASRWDHSYCSTTRCKSWEPSTSLARKICRTHS
jgi:hypothetical protein